MPKILVVEDEADLRTLVADKLRGAGYDVHEAADGEEGFRKAGELRPDLIISDVVMPKLDGNRLLKRLRESEFGRRIPFIVLTARIKMRDYFEVVDVAAFLEKPLNGEVLLAKVRDVLAGKVEEGSAGGQKHGSPEAVLPPVKESKDSTSSIECLVQDDLIDKGSLETADAVLAEVRYRKEKDNAGRRKKGLAKMKILAVENDPAACKGLQVLLGRHYDMKILANPALCIQETNSGYVPDLVLAKYDLPGMNAHQLANVLKENFLYKHVPIIIYNNIGHCVEWAGDSGMKAQPFTLNDEGKEMLRQVYQLLEP